MAIDFANTVYHPSEPAGALRSWGDVVRFLKVTVVIPARGAAKFRAGATASAGTAAAALTQALGLRQTIREVLRALEAREPLNGQWVDTLNEVLRADRGVPALVAKAHGWELAFIPEGEGLLTALVPVARSMAELIAEGPNVPVRKCGNPKCVLYFYDDSRTGRRRWCSMALCGNRMKVAALARRRRSGGAASQP